MKQSVIQFNAWIVTNFDTLMAALPDNDAFQDAYLATARKLQKHPERGYASIFLSEYRIAQKHGLNLSFQYYRPNPLFFDFLKEDDTEVEQTAPRPSVEEIDRFCRAYFTQEDYTFFKLKFKNGMPNTVLAEFLGITTKAVSAKVHSIQSNIQSKFAQAI